MRTHTRPCTYANYARSTARPCLADHSHGYSTAASAVLPRRKVLNGEAGLKKGSGGANASASEGTSGVISRSAKKLYFMIAATFKPPTMRYVRSLARSLTRSRTIIPCILSRDYECLARLSIVHRAAYHFAFINLTNFDKLGTFISLYSQNEFCVFFKDLFYRNFRKRLNNFSIINLIKLTVFTLIREELGMSRNDV